MPSQGEGKEPVERQGAVVQHSCAFGCSEEKFPVQRAVHNSLRGICVFGGRTGAVQTRRKQNCQAGSEQSFTQERPEEDARRTGHDPDILDRVPGLSHQDASSRSLCLTATSGPVLCELFQCCFEATGISGSQNIP